MPRPPKKFRDHPFAYHEEFELEVDTLTNLGIGLGRVELGPGRWGLDSFEVPVADAPGQTPPEQVTRSWVVMVRGALPGERVRVRVFRNQKNYSEADLVGVVRASVERVEPECPLFGLCGGCQYQNLAYPAQLDWKRQQVVELLEHLAGLSGVAVDPVVGSPRQYGYRSKLTPHFHKPKGRPEADIGAIGFLRAGTRHSIVDVPRCPIAMPAINRRLESLREEVRAHPERFRRGATLLLRAVGEDCHTDPEDEIEEEVDGVQLRFLARDFFQNNPFILPRFTAHARAEASACGARNLVDAYCGSGLFALTLARAFERVVGIEISETAVERAGANARLNGIDNARFMAGSAEAIFAGLEFEGRDTAVVIDPPRKGASEEFLEQLFAFGPRRVVYISCNPATQMRDLKLCVVAGYRVVRVTPFDLFPQTRHLECVATLERG